ncbi:putative mitochondrial ATP-dependent RNA helicase Suv3 [Talaromyces proteolyticus]|uniref:RNA helicase n=1 Tax=Talaromyces proteolyticus TaxID=1131652 RepID=A0AAD4KMJ6_9EURO|nr:putative mitochondrial ATP-dependent RNA helicase Suv3 [Talaromyces proteolyticus]KAH8696118.1 putative mitochondrial ATP-dependent RNA helicase Suv3 [Talaromyces proteolyticus]
MRPLSRQCPLGLDLGMKARTTQAWQCLFCSIRPRLTTLSTLREFTAASQLARKPGGGSKGSKSQSSSRGSPIIYRRNDQNFAAVVRHALEEHRRDLDPFHPTSKTWDAFSRRISQAVILEDGFDVPKKGNLLALKHSLWDAYRARGATGVRSEIISLQRNEEFAKKYGDPNIDEQKKLADLRYPAEWYPHARAKRRTIHLHVGPTNSGKTYQALKRLEGAQKGFYAGPLRLLAQEVYSRFTAQGIPCGLITGDEVRIPDASPRILSNTVEMVSLNKDFEVGVIDEIQMIADPDRGWAWTRAFMGSRVRELHLCGELRVVPLIKELVALTGDVLEIHQYQRLNPLKAEQTSLQNDLRRLQKGDCLVVFSRIGIHAFKNQIEKATGRRAAIVYGGLPAEIRTQQANLFNDPDNDYDFLVASDAIGMGLNLKCRRIIFHTLVKGRKNGLHRLTIPEIKQIGGRAGRYRAANEKEVPKQSAEPNVGLVTSLEDVDLPYIRQALEFEPPPIKTAGVFPGDTVFQLISGYFPSDVSFKFLVNRVLAVCQVHPLFFLCRGQAQLESAGVIDSSHELTIDDRLVFMASPLYDRDPILVNVAKAFIRCVATNTSGRLLDIPELHLEILEAPVSGDKDYMTELESLHKSLILYLWLSYRMGGVFTDRTLATHVKTMVEERMMRALSEFSVNKKLRIAASIKQRIIMEQQYSEEQRLLAEAGTTKTSNPTGDAFDLPVSENTLSEGEAQNTRDASNTA